MNCWWECTKNELSALKNLQIDNSLSKFRIIATVSYIFYAHREKLFSGRIRNFFLCSYRAY